MWSIRRFLWLWLRYTYEIICCLYQFNSLFVKVFTENLALHQPAWQSSTHLSYTGAERAVDGRYTDLYVYGGQCAASDGGQTAEWRVDLGEVRNIHHVLIQHARDNIVWGTVSFNLLILFNLTTCYYIYSFYWIEVAGGFNIHYVCITLYYVWQATTCVVLYLFTASLNVIIKYQY